MNPLKLLKTGELVADGWNESSAAAWSVALQGVEERGVGGRGGVRLAFSFQLAKRASGVSSTAVGTTSSCWWVVAGGFRGGGVEEDEASVLMSAPRCARRTVRFQMTAAAFFFVRLAFRVLLIFPMTLEYPWIRKNVLSNKKDIF